MTSAMPTGGVDGNTGDDSTAAAGSGGWLPPVRLGLENPGVYSDARGLVAGQTTNAAGSITAKSVAAAGDAMYQESAAVGATGGVGPLDVGGPVADSMPTGGAGAGPTPKATSQAQRDANNAEAQRENPGYQGAG